MQPFTILISSKTYLYIVQNLFKKKKNTDKILPDTRVYTVFKIIFFID